MGYRNLLWAGTLLGMGERGGRCTIKMNDTASDGMGGRVQTHQEVNQQVKGK